MGTNTIVGTDANKIVTAAFDHLKIAEAKTFQIPPLWDGQTAGRIPDALS
jgi:hypothetical protein